MKFMFTFTNVDYRHEKTVFCHEKKKKKKKTSLEEPTRTEVNSEKAKKKKLTDI